MKWGSNVAYALLNTCNHHHNETHFIFSIFVSMPRPKSIYVVSAWSIFHLQSQFHCHITSFKQTCLFFVHFLRISPIIIGCNVDQQRKKLSNSNSLASGCCLVFAWFFASFSLALLIKVLLMKKLVINFYSPLKSLDNQFALMLPNRQWHVQS